MPGVEVRSWNRESMWTFADGRRSDPTMRQRRRSRARNGADVFGIRVSETKREDAVDQVRVE